MADRLADCPNCGAEYPDFHSPVGTIETVCDNCGLASDEGREHEDVRLIHRHRMTGPGADQTDDEFWQDIVRLAVCPQCGEGHPEFGSVSSVEDGLHTACKSCGWSSKAAHARSVGDTP
jgi:rubredoxin